MSEEEIEAIRRKKLLELQKRLLEERRKAQVELQKQLALRSILTPKARQRLTNIKLVRPQFAEQLELQLIQAAQSGRVKTPITDEQLKELLAYLQKRKREISIKWK
jgi:programmed cell death protein 5